MNIKKILMILMASFMLFGCSDSPDTEEKEKENPVSSSEEEKEQEEDETNEGTIQIGDTFTVGDYQVTINSTRLGKDYEDKTAIVINYDWTNNSEETTSAWLSVGMQAFQNGEEIESAIGSGDSDKDMKDIRPGNTLEGIEKAFTVNDENEIELEVSEFMSFSNEKFLLILEYPTE